MENNEAYSRAKQRVEAKIGFYVHLAVFIGVNVLLTVINLVNSPEVWWAKWPLIGWGFAVVVHGVVTFLFSGTRVTEQMIEKEMRGRDWGRKA
jgi:hypothetical protein